MTQLPSLGFTVLLELMMQNGKWKTELPFQKFLFRTEHFLAD